MLRLHWWDCVKIELIERLLEWIRDRATTGAWTACAMHFQEWVLDKGLLAIMFNTDGEIAAYEIQLSGRVLFHADAGPDWLSYCNRTWEFQEITWCPCGRHYFKV